MGSRPRIECSPILVVIPGECRGKPLNADSIGPVVALNLEGHLCLVIDVFWA